MRTLLSARAWLALWIGLFAAMGAHAQVLDEVDVERAGRDAVVHARFARSVRLQRVVSSSDSELTLVLYTVTGVNGNVGAVEPPTERRIAGRGSLPTITLTDESAGARANDRKLVVRVVPAARVMVRAGRDARTLDVVLAGLGEQVGPALPITAAATPLMPDERFQILLHSSTDPMMQLPAPVPGSVQEYGLTTGKRVAGGETYYDFYLGPFATQAEAARALELVRGRFPNAAIVSPPVDKAHAAPPTPAPAQPGTAGAAAPTAPPTGASAGDIDARAGTLMSAAREALSKGDTAAAIDALGKVLDLPPNASSREAQALVGDVWAGLGETERARREYELFVKLYPEGSDTERIAAKLRALPAPTAVAVEKPAAQKVQPTTSTFTGSIGSFYYGGQSKIRSEEFKDSGLGSLPELVQNPTIAATDQKLSMTSVDLNYRYRSPEDDLRFVFRDTYQANLMPGRPSRNRLSSAYVDYRSLAGGWNVKLGRQSPSGGGVMSRFDGVAAGYTFAPKWKVNASAGRPVDPLLETRRHFVGASIDADALTEHIGGSLYLNEQRIDGYTDRRAVGLDGRYFREGMFVSGNLDYDLEIRALNIAALQGMWMKINEDGSAGTTVNFLADRRAQPLVALGNALFFQDPNGTMLPVRMSDALALRDLETLRHGIRATTAYSTQGLLGFTTPLTKHWQAGADVRLTRIDEIAPVPDILPMGQPATGNIWGLGGQLIGTNLYSERDTHVFTSSLQRGPSFRGVLATYNNVSVLDGGWQVEPNIQYYRQTSSIDGSRLARVKPGLRVSWRFVTHAVVESSIDYEITRITSPTRNEDTDRVFYYLGGRYEF